MGALCADRRFPKEDRVRHGRKPGLRKAGLAGRSVNRLASWSLHRVASK
jgi:hypothetical protein